MNRVGGARRRDPGWSKGMRVRPVTLHEHPAGSVRPDADAAGAVGLVAHRVPTWRISCLRARRRGAGDRRARGLEPRSAIVRGLGGSRPPPAARRSGSLVWAACTRWLVAACQPLAWRVSPSICGSWRRRLRAARDRRRLRASSRRSSRRGEPVRDAQGRRTLGLCRRGRPTAARRPGRGGRAVVLPSAPVSASSFGRLMRIDLA
jgi:hypothetical protein